MIRNRIVLLLVIGSIGLVVRSNGQEQKPKAPPPAQSKTDPKAPASPPVGPVAPVHLSVDDFLKQGQQQIVQGHFDEAAKTYREASALYPKEYRIYQNLAFADLNLKQYDEAATAAKKAIDLNETEPNLYNLLSEAALQQNRFKVARQAANMVIQLQPGQSSAWVQLGQVELRAKNYRDALKAYLTALGLSPDDISVHAALGDTYEQLNRHESAVSEYEAALHILDKMQNAKTGGLEKIRSGLMLSHAVALAGAKRYAEAEAEARKILAADPKDVTAHSSLAQVLDSASKFQDSIAEYRTAIAITPSDAILWGNLGWAQFGAGSYDDAVQSSQKALQLDSTLSYVRFNLGLIYAVRNQWDLAHKEYEGAIKGAAPADVEAGMSDLRDAIEKDPNSTTLKQALDLLTAADETALGMVE